MSRDFGGHDLIEVAFSRNHVRQEEFLALSKEQVFQTVQRGGKRKKLLHEHHIGHVDVNAAANLEPAFPVIRRLLEMTTEQIAAGFS